MSNRNQAKIIDIPGAWDEILKTEKYYLKDPNPWVVETIKTFRKTRPGTYLDLGCGFGRHLEPFIAYPELSVGLDFASAAVSVTRQKTKGKGVVIQASMTSIPFKEGTFDTILAWRSIYLLQSNEIARAIDEIYRVLKTKGNLLCSVRSTENTLYYVGKDKARELEPGTFKFPDRDFMGTIYHFFSEQEIVDRFSKFEIHDLHLKELSHTAFTTPYKQHKNSFWVFRAVKRE